VIVPDCLVLGYRARAEHENPSQDVAQALDGETIAGVGVRGVVLPTDSKAVADAIRQEVEVLAPRLMIGTGVARSAFGLLVERVGVNLLDFQMPDGAGNRPSGVPVIDGGPPAYFATVPAKAMVAAIRSAGVPARVSHSASTHMCNQSLYLQLHLAATRGGSWRAGFIHVPNRPEFVAHQSEWGPSLSVDAMVTGVRAAIAAALVWPADVETNLEEWEW
jgi:pyroglutamyl-peptidase